MKAHKLVLYAAAGVIVGLLIENNALIVQQRLALKTRRLKRQTDKLLEKHGH